MIVEPVYEEYSLKAEMVGDVAVMKYHMVSHNETHIFAKRVLDIMGAMAGMVLFGIAYIIVGTLDQDGDTGTGYLQAESGR